MASRDPLKRQRVSRESRLLASYQRERSPITKGENAPGVFAPAGWHCRVWYGSSVSSILVTPPPIETTQFLPPKVLGPAVDMDFSFAGTSGRFTVARYASRLFPRVLARFIEGVRNEHLVPDSTLALPPYARDSVTAVDSSVPEFHYPTACKWSRNGRLSWPIA